MASSLKHGSVHINGWLPSQYMKIFTDIDLKGTAQAVSERLFTQHCGYQLQ
jgi:hypothetical protein